jgi:hypothetical protein
MLICYARHRRWGPLTVLAAKVDKEQKTDEGQKIDEANDRRGRVEHGRGVERRSWAEPRAGVARSDQCALHTREEAVDTNAMNIVDTGWFTRLDRARFDKS